MLENIKGAIFDLDGTVLDSMCAWREVDLVFLKRHGLPYDAEYLEAVKTMFHGQAAPYTIERFGLDMTPEEIIAEWRSGVDVAYRHTVQAKPYAVEYIKLLKERGVAIAAATSTDEEHGILALKRLGLYDLFDSITFTMEAARPKGYPDVYELAAERIGLQPHECAVYEDILVGVRAAKAGGFISVAVFDDSSDMHWGIMKLEADIAIMSFAELLQE